MLRIFLTLISATFSLPGLLGAGEVPFVHLQTDRTSYRIGETIWFRAHTRGMEPVGLSLRTLEGKEAARVLLDGREDPPYSGRILVPDGSGGGTFRLEARVGGDLVHEVVLEIYDLAAPRLDLDLAILGEVHRPGKTVTASFRARDLSGRAVKGARVEYRASFGPVAIRQSAGVTDDEGRALLRFTLPEDVVRSGQLAVGLALPGKEAAVARPVQVSRSVARFDAFPEGGSILEDAPQRLGLLALDRDGQTTAVTGRVLDREGQTVADFKTGIRGLATAVVPYREGQSYRAVIDEPAGVEEEFPLPGPAGHRLAILVEEGEAGFQVGLRGRYGEAGKRFPILLAQGGRVLWKGELRLRPVEGKKSVAGQTTIPRPKLEGLAQILVLEKGRALLKRMVFQGARSPIAVTVKPKERGPLFPGKTAEFEIRATLGGVPVQADLGLSFFQGDPAAIPDLVVRSLLGDGATPGVSPPTAALEMKEEREAFLLVHQAFRYPPEGAPLGADGLPDPEAGRLATPTLIPPPISPPFPPPRARTTVARAPSFERLLERAAFTRPVLEGLTQSFHPNVGPEVLLASPGLGKLSPVLPQLARFPANVLDSRRTIFWNGSVRTDASGRAAVTVRFNHLVSALSWVAQGFAGELPVSARGSVLPTAGFRTRFDCPGRVQVGDLLDLLLEVESPDSDGGPVEIEFRPPACLKPLLRTRMTFDPQKDARLHRFQFDAREAVAAAELRVVARRGLYEEVQVRPLQVLHKEVELDFGKAGRALGSASFSVQIPGNAVPDSVRARASVYPGFPGKAEELRAEMVQQPSGCFEQFTSINGLNLAILDALLEKGQDPLALETAFGFAQQGFRRLLTHHDPASGGFSLWPGKAAELHPTLVAVRQLALHGRVFEGQGRRELEASLRWLEPKHLSTPELLYVTLALHDLGRSWKGSAAAANVETTNLYETALQAGCLTSWPDLRSGSPESGKKSFQGKLEKLLDALQEGLETPGNVAKEGTGIMGSTGGQLSLEVRALAAVALHQGGREDAARDCLSEMLDRECRYGGTQGRALAIRALGRLTPPLPEGRLEVAFAAGSEVERVVGNPARARPLAFERALPLKPGNTAKVSLDIRSTVPQAYRLGVTCRVPEPSSSPDAPFSLSVQMAREADQGSPVDLRISIEPRRRTSSSQVVARLGIPAGIEVQTQDLEELVKQGEVSYFEIGNGRLDLYWSRRIERPLHFTVSALARVAGRFTAPPSFIYPYYESGREFVARPLSIRIHNNFGQKTEMIPPGVGRKK